MTRMFTVQAKHWWNWLSPSFRRHRRAVQAFLDAYQDEIQERITEDYKNLMIYGCTVAPQEFYGESIADAVMKDLAKAQKEKEDGLQKLD